jgi:hypothetical protein
MACAMRKPWLRRMRSHDENRVKPRAPTPSRRPAAPSAVPLASAWLRRSTRILTGSGFVPDGPVPHGWARSARARFSPKKVGSDPVGGLTLGRGVARGVVSRAVEVFSRGSQ